MGEDIWNIGLQGGIGRGIDGMWTGSAVMGRRRWRRRDLEEVARVEEEMSTPKSEPEKEKPPVQPQRPPETSL